MDRMGHMSGRGGNDPINLRVCITKIMKPLMIIFPFIVMATIILIKVLYIFPLANLLDCPSIRLNYQRVMMTWTEVMRTTLTWYKLLWVRLRTMIKMCKSRNKAQTQID